MVMSHKYLCSYDDKSWLGDPKSALFKSTPKHWGIQPQVFASFYFYLLLPCITKYGHGQNHPSPDINSMSVYVTITNKASRKITFRKKCWLHETLTVHFFKMKRYSSIFQLFCEDLATVSLALIYSIFKADMTVSPTGCHSRQTGESSSFTCCKLVDMC